MTEEVSKEKKAILKLLKKHIKSSLLKCSWNVEGLEILKDKNKIAFTNEEKAKLKFLIAQGTPKEYRANLWKSCSGAKKDIEDSPEYYLNLKKLSQEVPSLSLKQINSDIKRTNPKKNSDPNFLQKLKNILVCYSIRNSSIGYCQGFNFIACRILETLIDEEDAFWVFTELIEEILPINYYSELCGVIVDTTIVNILLKKYFPKLKSLFSNEMLNSILNNFLQQSILGLFTCFLKEETSYLIWDFLILEGSSVLFKAFIGIFSTLQKSLLASNEDIVVVKDILEKDIQKIPETSLQLIHTLAIRKFEFNDDFLEQKRFNFSEKVTQMLESTTLENVHCKVQSKEDEKLHSQLKLKCSKNWPYCLNDFYFQNVTQIVTYQVFSHREQINLREDYFFEDEKVKEEIRYSYMESESEEKPYDILLERRPHYCSEVIEEIQKERMSNVNKDAETVGDEIEGRVNMLDNTYQKILRNTKFQKETTRIMDSFVPEPFKDIVPSYSNTDLKNIEEEEK